MKKEWKEQFDLQDRTCDALLLQFDRDYIIKNGFYIPNPHEVRACVMDQRDGVEQKRVSDRLWDVLQRGSSWNEETDSIFEGYLFRLGGNCWSGSKTEGEWFYGFD